MQFSQKTILAAAFAVCVAAQQIEDGQVIADTTVAPASQITDGQIQVTTSAPVAPVTQITDGQIQVTTSAPVAPVTQIPDGQIQAPTGISGVPAPTQNGTTIAPATPSPSAFTGAGNIMAWSKEIAVVAVGAAAGLVML